MTESTSTTRDPVEVHVAGADLPEAARLLLDAAKATGHPVESVATIQGGFLVPYEVAEHAGAVKGEQVTPSETELAAHPETAGPPETVADPAEDGEEEQPAVVETADGVQHTGTIPAEAAIDGEEDQADGEGEQGEETGTPVLRGEALEQALRDRDLSTSGTADEKRARVAEYDAAKAAGTSQR